MKQLATFALKYKLYLGIFAVLILVLSVAYCSGRGDGRAAIEQQIERANTKAVQRNAKAGEAAAEARVKDALEVQEIEQELVNAVEATPDTLPSDRRIARGCVQLRQSGRDTASIPACAGY